MRYLGVLRVTVNTKFLVVAVAPSVELTSSRILTTGFSSSLRTVPIASNNRREKRRRRRSKKESIFWILNREVHTNHIPRKSRCRETR